MTVGARAAARRAQIHILELMTAVIILVVVMTFVSSLQVPAPRHDDSLKDLERHAQDALRTADSRPTGGTYGNSSLVQWVVEENSTAVEVFLDENLPLTASFRMFAFRDSVDTSYVLAGDHAPVSDSVTVHRLLAWSGSVYDVRLQVWFEPR